MKSLFPSFQPLSDDEKAAAWRDAMFVFDTNVLLGLYRLPKVEREALLGVIRKLSPRIWVPHQVALEFHRRRATVIASQNAQFEAVRKTVESAAKSLHDGLGKLNLKGRHSVIETETFEAKVDALVTEFLKGLGEREKQERQPSDDDPILAEVYSLFDGKVGAVPAGQQALDELHKQAKARYAKKIPPGYEDDVKAKGEEGVYSFDGLEFDRRYGDFVLWRQLLDHAKANDIRSVVFVTDDQKEDWYEKLKVDGAAEKTIGPRRELVEEAKHLAGVERLLLYPTHRFLDYASKFLKAGITDEMIATVRDVSALSLRDATTGAQPQQELLALAVQHFAHRARADAVVRVGPREPSCDFLIDHGSHLEAFELRICPAGRLPDQDFLQDSLATVDRMAMGWGSELYPHLVLVADSREALRRIEHSSRFARARLRRATMACTLALFDALGSPERFLVTKVFPRSIAPLTSED